MGQLTRRFVSFLDRNDGPAAVDYAITLSVIVMLCVLAVRTLGLDKPTSGKTIKAVSAAR